MGAGLWFPRANRVCRVGRAQSCTVDSALRVRRCVRAELRAEGPKLRAASCNLPLCLCCGPVPVGRNAAGTLQAWPSNCRKKAQKMESKRPPVDWPSLGLEAAWPFHHHHLSHPSRPRGFPFAVSLQRAGRRWQSGAKRNRPRATTGKLAENRPFRSLRWNERQWMGPMLPVCLLASLPACLFAALTGCQSARLPSDQLAAS